MPQDKEQTESGKIKAGIGSARAGNYTISGRKIGRDSIMCQFAYDQNSKSEELHRDLIEKMLNPISEGTVKIEALKAYLVELAGKGASKDMIENNIKIGSDIANMLDAPDIEGKFSLTIYLSEFFLNHIKVMKQLIDVQFDLKSLEPFNQESDKEEEKQDNNSQGIEKEENIVIDQKTDFGAERLGSNKITFNIKCLKNNEGQVISYLDYDGLGISKKAYKRILGELPSINIDNPVETLNRHQLEEMLLWLADSELSSDKNADLPQKILGQFDESQTNDEFSFSIVISEYYRQDGQAMRPYSAIELDFQKPVKPETKEKPSEKRQLTTEELIVLQEQMETLKNDINKLQMEKAGLEEINSKLEKINSELKSENEIGRLINEFQSELRQIRQEKNELIKKTLTLNDEILELKRDLLKVKYDGAK